MIVTIDGPAGAGKSTTARALAHRLGFRFLDTGAMYRAAALAGLRARIDWQDEPQLVAMVAELAIDLRDERVFLAGEDVTQEIRRPEVAEVVHQVADPPGVRRLLVERQRAIAAHDNFVTEGRDQGTVVFPQAECKIYLTATAEERARRRAQQQTADGPPVDWQQVLRQQTERDRRDAARPVGRLEKAADAVEFVTDGWSQEEVVDQLEQLVRQRMRPQAAPGAGGRLDGPGNA